MFPVLCSLLNFQGGWTLRVTTAENHLFSSGGKELFDLGFFYLDLPLPVFRNNSPIKGIHAD